MLARGTTVVLVKVPERLKGDFRVKVGFVGEILGIRELKGVLQYLVKLEGKSNPISVDYDEVAVPRRIL